MRSSKQRSRKNQNRNRSVGNVVNRVFDSSGPEGKVRGTPQQIIEKYNQLARDAQLSGDRVATENFQQHAEHYTRMLAEAMREQEARREAHEAQQRERQQNRQQERGGQQQNNRGGGDAQAGQPQPDGAPQPEFAAQEQPNEPPVAMPADAPQPDIMDIGQSADSGLVETPESKPEPKPKRPRRPRKKPEAEAPADGGSDGGDAGPAEAAE